MPPRRPAVNAAAADVPSATQQHESTLVKVFVLESSESTELLDGVLSVDAADPWVKFGRPQPARCSCFLQNTFQIDGLHVNIWQTALFNRHTTPYDKVFNVHLYATSPEFTLYPVIFQTVSAKGTPVDVTPARVLKIVKALVKQSQSTSSCATVNMTSVGTTAVSRCAAAVTASAAPASVPAPQKQKRRAQVLDDSDEEEDHLHDDFSGAKTSTSKAPLRGKSGGGVSKVPRCNNPDGSVGSGSGGSVSVKSLLSAATLSSSKPASAKLGRPKATANSSKNNNAANSKWADKCVRDASINLECSSNESDEDDEDDEEEDGEFDDFINDGTTSESEYSEDEDGDEEESSTGNETDDDDDDDDNKNTKDNEDEDEDDACSTGDDDGSDDDDGSVDNDE